MVRTCLFKVAYQYPLGILQSRLLSQVVAALTRGTYKTQEATTFEVYRGFSNSGGQAVVNAGTGDDLIVLGPNDILKDVVELDGSFGNDTIVGFTRYDRINLAGILEAGKSLITDAGADALRDNAVVVVTDAVAADAENGIFTATEVQTLITEGKLGFGAAAADALPRP